MAQKKSGRWHTIYSIVSTAVEELAIAALLFWILPLFGLTLPVWASIVILVGFAVFSYIMYLVGHPTVLYEDASSPEAIVGCHGIVERPFDPEGLVRVCGELWKATSSDIGLKRGEDIIVTSMNGLKLTVKRKPNIRVQYPPPDKAP